jgi:hypothetical protein
MLAISAGLYAYLDHARNDVAVTTRSLVKQVRKVEALAEAEIKAVDENGADSADRMLKATERLERAQARLFIRFHHPERDPDEGMQRFDELWRLLREGDPETVRYSEKQPKGDPAAHKRVVLRSRDRDGDSIPLTLEWVRFRGGWYVDDFHHQDETASAD